MKVKSIDIDLEVYKAIESRRQSFEESQNDILRRELRVRDDEGELGQEAETTAPSSDLRGRGIFLSGGVVLPAGTELRLRYQGQERLAEVRNGRIWLNGTPFGTPSGAAMSVTKNHVNGWRLWQVRRPDDTEWLTLDSLRRKTG